MRATIKDIAVATGFSVTTISLVLNGKAHKISDETKKRILDAAEQMHYRPNQLAVSLVKKRSKTIGLIVPDIANVYFANMARGVDEACREHGFTVILCNTNESHDRDMEYINMLADKGADGILYIMAKDSTQEMGLEAVELMEELKMPYVILDRLIEARYPGIATDHETGGYLAASHLIRLGHRKLACVTGPIGTLADSQRRLRGFLCALREWEIPVRMELICEGSFTPEGGAAAVDELMNYEFTAIFACNDASAYGVCRRLKEYGKRVPEDVSVVGYDDVLYAEMLEVPLTTVRQKVYAMGMEAVRRLTALIRQESAMERSIIFEPELIVRNSTARVYEAAFSRAGGVTAGRGAEHAAVQSPAEHASDTLKGGEAQPGDCIPSRRGEH